MSLLIIFTNLKQLLWNLLYEAMVMRPPQAQPKE